MELWEEFSVSVKFFVVFWFSEGEVRFGERSCWYKAPRYINPPHSCPLTMTLTATDSASRGSSLRVEGPLPVHAAHTAPRRQPVLRFAATAEPLPPARLPYSFSTRTEACLIHTHLCTSVRVQAALVSSAVLARPQRDTLRSPTACTATVHCPTIEHTYIMLARVH